ncbi:MAG: efflux RND transporter permease subunit [Hymenobacter sp.]
MSRYVDSLQIGGVEHLRSNLQDRNPEIAVNINRTRANREGISTAQIGPEVRTAIYGTEASKFKTADDEYPIQVRYAEPYRYDVDAMRERPAHLPRRYRRRAPGAHLGGGRRYLRHHLRRHQAQGHASSVITISSNVLKRLHRPRRGAPDVANGPQSLPYAAGYTVKMGGAQEDQKETSDFLRRGRPRGHRRSSS